MNTKVRCVNGDMCIDCNLQGTLECWLEYTPPVKIIGIDTEVIVLNGNKKKDEKKLSDALENAFDVIDKIW